MNKFKFLTSLIFLFFVQFSFGQMKLQLDSIQLNYQVPEDFEIKPENYIVDFLGGKNPLLEVHKPEEQHVNFLKVDYQESHNLKSLTLDIYALTLVEAYKKGYNTEAFSAEVQLERKTIQNQDYYLIRSMILHKESNYQYVSDVYLAEILEKEFMVTITYDNDEDKQKLEESFFNSYFS